MSEITANDEHYFDGEDEDDPVALLAHMAGVGARLSGVDRTFGEEVFEEPMLVEAFEEGWDDADDCGPTPDWTKMPPAFWARQGLRKPNQESLAKHMQQAIRLRAQEARQEKA